MDHMVEVERTRPAIHRRTQLSNGQPYRAVPKATETDLRRTPEDTLRRVPKRLGFRASLGVVSSALDRIDPPTAAFIALYLL